MTLFPNLNQIYARDPNEPHRASTTLELLFDLVYVICRNSDHSLLTLLTSLAILGLSFYAVQLGLPITYGIWLSILAPIVMTVKFNRDKAQPKAI